jgi:hypothetical protein
MEANQFVLMSAVFIIIAAYMVSIPSAPPAPAALPVALLTCRFDNFCSGIPCAKRKAPEISIFAPGTDGWSLISRSDTPSEYFRLARSVGESRVTYSSLQRPGQGATSLVITNSGAMRLEQTDRNGAVIMAGEGYCREPAATDAAKRNGDKV